MYEDAIRVRRQTTLARLCALEKALKLGVDNCSFGESYDGKACGNCATCLPKREFLKSVETLTSPDAAVKRA